MSYAIDVLKKERDLIQDCLSDWEKENYQEARKRQSDKLKSLNSFIDKLEGNSYYTDKCYLCKSCIWNHKKYEFKCDECLRTIHYVSEELKNLKPCI